MKKVKQPCDVIVEAPFAMLGLCFEKGILKSVEYLKSSSTPVEPEGPAEKQACRQIEDYCAGKLRDKIFDIPYEVSGTAFQQKVWHELEAIPYGETRTYGEIARSLKTSARAVGNACRKNPLTLVVPCHRVVSAKGIGGYSGKTAGGMLKIKQWLLEHEKASF